MCPEISCKIGCFLSVLFIMKSPSFLQLNCIWKSPKIWLFLQPTVYENPKNPLMVFPQITLYNLHRYYFTIVTSSQIIKVTIVLVGSRLLLRTLDVVALDIFLSWGRRKWHNCLCHLLNTCILIFWAEDFSRPNSWASQSLPAIYASSSLSGEVQCSQVTYYQVSNKEGDIGVCSILGLDRHAVKK